MKKYDDEGFICQSFGMENLMYKNFCHKFFSRCSVSCLCKASIGKKIGFSVKKLVACQSLVASVQKASLEKNCFECRQRIWLLRLSVSVGIAGR